MFKLKQSKLADCFELQPRVFDDDRGRFIKVFHEREFSAPSLEINSAEEYYLVSYQNVIGGIHFQLLPMDHVKVVYCVEGEVTDAVVDLRVGSHSYGQYTSFELSAAKANSIYIPKGIVHGFCVRSEQAFMCKVSTIYSPAHDAGILWNSVGIQWPTENGVLSARDQGYPTLEQFKSAFRYE